MPRNSSGTYSLYTPGNPVVPSTVITTTWANNTLSDLATALTDSLSRNGDGGMLAQLQLVAGAVGAPGLSWTAEPTSGLYRAGAGDFRYSVQGVDRTTWTTTGFSVTGTLSSSGAATLASLAVSAGATVGTTLGVTGNTTIGGTLGVTGNSTFTGSIVSGSATGGPQGAGTINATGLFVNGVAASTAAGANPTGSVGLAAVNGVATTFMRSDAAPALSQSIAPTWTGQHAWTLALRAPDGSAGTPAYSFSGDLDTGIYRRTANSIGFGAGGVEVFVVEDGNIRVGDGSAAVPGILFLNDLNTGIYRVGDDTLGISTGGTNRVTINNSGVLVGAATGGAQGNGTVNATGVYDDGLQIFPNIPRSTTTTTLVASDLGKCVAVSAAIAIPASVFSAGDTIMVYNDSASAVNITIAAGTLRLAGTTTTGTRSLAARGIATLWFNVGGATPEVIASGNVT